MVQSLLYNQEMTTAGIQTTVVGKVNSELLPQQQPNPLNFRGFG